MIGEVEWTEVLSAIEDARKFGTDAASFLSRLERHGLTVLPLAVRRNADLFGIGMVARLDGHRYNTLDPVGWVIKESIHEDRQHRR